MTKCVENIFENKLIVCVWRFGFLEIPTLEVKLPQTSLLSHLIFLLSYLNFYLDMFS